jgi:hypothetical protein
MWDGVEPQLNLTADEAHQQCADAATVFRGSPALEREPVRASEGYCAIQRAQEWADPAGRVVAQGRWL